MAVFRRRSEKVEALSKVPLFSSLSKKDLDEVARHADEATVRAGTTLTREGSAGNAFYLIAQGTAVVQKSGRKIATLKRGDVVGEMSLLDGEPRSATVVMETDGCVLEIPRRDFTALLDRVPGIAAKLLVSMSRRLREADRLLVD